MRLEKWRSAMSFRFVVMFNLVSGGGRWKDASFHSLRLLCLPGQVAAFVCVVERAYHVDVSAAGARMV